MRFGGPSEISPAGWIYRTSEFIPISALKGDNVVDASDKMPWYEGPTLLHDLEHIHVAADRNLQDCRFPVQYVIRPQTDAHRDFRGYAGRVAGGVFKVGDEVLALPSGISSQVTSISIGEKSVDKAFPPQSVVMTLANDIDLSRGDMLVRENNQPESAQDLDVRICWLSDQPMRPGARFELRHTSREVKAVVKEVVYKLDINTLHRMEDDLTIGMNDIARVRIRTAAPVLVDDYRRNRSQPARSSWWIRAHEVDGGRRRGVHLIQQVGSEPCAGFH